MGPEMAPPRGVPDIDRPRVRPRLWGAYQLLTILLVETLKGPSAMPNSTRITISAAKPEASTVRPLNADQSTIASSSVVLAP